MKLCSKCGVVKPRSEFPPRRLPSGKVSVYAHCVDCTRLRTAEWRKANPDKSVAYTRKWQQANPEKVAAWKEANPDSARRASRKYREKHPAKYVDWALERYYELKELRSEHVERDRVYERDGGICGLCNMLVNPDDWHLDHIIPVDHRRCVCVWKSHAAPTHTYANTRVTHPTCNRWKKERLDRDLPPMPLRVLAAAREQAAIAQKKLSQAA